MKRAHYTQKTDAKTNNTPSQTEKTVSVALPNCPIQDLMLLQPNLGNQAVQRLFKSGVVQAKLRIGAPNDIYEQEADRVADQVMKMPDSAIDNQQSAIGKGKEGESIQMKPG